MKVKSRAMNFCGLLIKNKSSRVRASSGHNCANGILGTSPENSEKLINL